VWQTPRTPPDPATRSGTVRELIRRYGVQVALIGVAALWGGTFVMVAGAIARYPMYAFLGWRFAVAVVAFVAFYPRVLARIDWANVRHGLLAGAFLSAGYIFQTWGLDGPTRTTPARAAFITGLYVIITPLLQALLLRKVPKRSTLLGGAIAVVGLWVFSGVGASASTWVVGDTLVAVCALAYSFHMIVLGSTGDGHDVGVLTLVQLATVAVVCSVISAVREHVGPPSDPGVIVAILVCGVLASALAFVIQTWAQSKLPPARVALILVMEPAFGGLIGWTIAGSWPLQEVIGAATMLGGMVLAEVVAAAGAPAEATVLEPAVEGIPVPVVELPDAAVADGD